MKKTVATASVSMQNGTELLHMWGALDWDTDLTIQSLFLSIGCDMV